MKMYEVYKKNESELAKVGLGWASFQRNMPELVSAGFFKIDDDGTIHATMPDTGEVVGTLSV